MSLFTHEEICEGCKHARWVAGSNFWHGLPRFAKCELDVEDLVDAIRGKCELRERAEAAESKEKE